MSEAVAVARLMMTTSIGSEESLARDRNTDRQAHTQRLEVVYVKMCKVAGDFTKTHLIRPVSASWQE